MDNRELIKSKVNRLYFVDNKTITEISKIMNIHYNVALGAIERGDIYNFRNSQKNTKNNKEAVEIISKTVTEYYGLKDGLINKKTSIRDVVVPRQIAQTISYNLTKSSNSFIGKNIGSVIPCTVTHSRQAIAGYLSYKNNTKDAYLELEEICKTKLSEYAESNS